MMSSEIKLLDCTLRDGAYIVNGEFGKTAICGIIDKLQKAEVDIIECGWLKNPEHKLGTSYYHVPDDLKYYLNDKKDNIDYTVMIDWDRYDLKFLPICDHSSIDAIRVVFPHEKYREGIFVGKQIKEKGYKVYFQAANTLAYTNEELESLAECVNEINPVALSVVDTFGAMYEEDLERIVSVLDSKLNPNIGLGFHSHNNQQLSFSLTTHFIKLLSNGTRKVIVDSSLCGMGRGAGNATTELLVNYLDRKCGKHYDMDAIMDAIDVYMTSFLEKYRWGYSTSYFIAGMLCCHVNNIAYLSNNHHTSMKDMRNIIASLPEADRKKYDYDLLENKYIENQNRYIDDSETRELLRKNLCGRSVVLIAPGKTSKSEQLRINEYIKSNTATTIGVNAIVPGYCYDYLFFVNPGRYDYAANIIKDGNIKATSILLSNIKNNSDENELIIGYNNCIKRGWEHFDNAVICALRLLDYIGVEKVAIAGFDGFKDEYNESYADPLLPAINPGKKWSELNEEIRDMFSDFLLNAEHCKNVEFITQSYFSKN